MTMFVFEDMWLLFVIVLAYKIFDLAWRYPRLRLSTKTRNILVTGCDTGFGNRLTKRLDKKGFRVFAGCLTEEGVRSLSETCSSLARPFRLDVTKGDDVKQAVEYVKTVTESAGLWAVVNNAGIPGPVGQVSWMNKKDYDDVLSVNFHGVRHMCEAFLPMLKQSRGRIINTSSVLGRLSLSHLTPYAVSKHAVEAFSDALRRDLRPFGVSVHIIEPGYFKTNIVDFAPIKASYMRKWDSISDEMKMQYGKAYPQKCLETLQNLFSKISSNLDLVVDAYEHAILAVRPRTRYLVGLDARWLYAPFYILPDWFGDKMLAAFPLHNNT